MSGLGLCCDHWPGADGEGSTGQSWRRAAERSARCVIQGMLRRASEAAQRVKGANLALVLGKIRQSFYSSCCNGSTRTCSAWEGCGQMGLWSSLIALSNDICEARAHGRSCEVE
jgi:hypothetical protein